MGYRQPSSQIASPQWAEADGWSAALERAVRDPGMVRPVFQPIVDLRRGVVRGYEMLARFGGPPAASPAIWFAEAAKRGFGPQLEARMVRIGLAARTTLPPDTFLTINLHPENIGAAEVQAALAEHRRLHGVVLELTGGGAVDEERLQATLPALRERGAMIAIDDVAAAAELVRIAAVRPHFVKVDRGLVDGLDDDPARRQLVESLGAAASQVDAWVVGEGIERPAELDALMRLRVPLGQGFALARPEPAMIGPEVGLSGWIKQRSEVAAEPGRLWHELPPIDLDCWIVEARRRLSEEPGIAFLPVADELGRPVGLVSRARFAAGEVTLTPALCAGPEEEPATLARRAMARPPATRFDPVLCCDEVGRYLGPIEVERLVEALAAAN